MLRLKEACSWLQVLLTMKQAQGISGSLADFMHFMPITFTVSMIGAFSMAGLPPFNGFLSKEMFFTAMVQVTATEYFQS